MKAMADSGLSAHLTARLHTATLSQLDAELQERTQSWNGYSSLSWNISTLKWTWQDSAPHPHSTPSISQYTSRIRYSYHLTLEMEINHADKYN